MTFDEAKSYYSDKEIRDALDTARNLMAQGNEEKSPAGRMYFYKYVHSAILGAYALCTDKDSGPIAELLETAKKEITKKLEEVSHEGQ